MLEVIYGGWTKIRETVLTTFKDCKDVRYATLINLLENYIPLVLSIYGVILEQTTSSSIFMRCFVYGFYFTAFIVAIMTKHH